MLDTNDLTIPALGPAKIRSPLFEFCAECVKDTCEHCTTPANFVPDGARVLIQSRLDLLEGMGYGQTSIGELPSFELAGPRRHIYFDPRKLTAGIVTCGGLCPGLNDVIRALVMELHYRYRCRRIYGFRYGYEGFVADYGHDVLELTPEIVEGIHETGGTILGTSRGHQEPADIVDCLQRMGVNVLFTIGGDGTQRGAMAISEEARSRGAQISVVGIPKTIDNDILWLDKSFGFETAFSEAVEAVVGAHSEADSAFNGIGLVKLMGRDSGFIACHTALATGHVNLVLIPEVPFKLEGPGGVMEYLAKRLERRRHAVVIVAEGAGQEILAGESTETDASGNRRLANVGRWLEGKIKEYLTARAMPHTIKYIDPSYIIRSVPATPQDSLYCLRLAQGAVHAAMSGRTEMVIGRWQQQYVHLPMKMIIVGRKHVEPTDDLWLSVLEATGQPMDLD
jgi:6-phosphofructokinase 1